MHLLTTSSATLDDIVEAVDLGQPPGDIAVLSFVDSDLSGLAAAWEAECDGLPSVRLAHLRELRHPMSVDLWIDRVGAHAKVILIRLLGGLDWWTYGVERLSTLARERGLALAVLPGEDRDDPRLAAASTLPSAELDVLLRYFREGGRENLRALLRRLARHAGSNLKVSAPQVVPRFAGYLPREGAIDVERFVSVAPTIPIIFYRAMLLAADTAPVDALCEALTARGIEIARITLHVGLGTFAPLRVERLDQVRLHRERYTLSAVAADALNRAVREGRRIVAAGTTVVRTLEHCALTAGASELSAHSGETDIFISPGFPFRMVGALLTNFHLPQSSLLMLVSAFAGREHTLAAYRHAIQQQYRFFSYGDCMFIA